MSTDPRYEGKPLLRLIELYVIDAVGELAPEDAQRLEGMTPKLNEIYGTNGDWRAAIAKAVGFPENMPEVIREMWDKNRKIAEEGGQTLSAEQFAVMLVDTNIPQS